MDNYKRLISDINNHVKQRSKRDLILDNISSARMIGQPNVKNPIAQHVECNSDKGLLLIGNPGVGKTTIMLCLAKIKPINFVSFPILFRAIQNKTVSLSSFFKNSRTRIDEFDNDAGLECKTTKLIDCFDDVGAIDDEVIDFGNRINPFKEIVLNRYYHYEVTGEMQTMCVTSNLNDDGFIQKYGAQTWDRLREMCCIIIMSGKSLR